MKLPILIVRLSPFDRFLEFISSAMLLALISIPLYYYNRLPQPTLIDFDRIGLDRYFDNSSVILILPVVGLVFYLGLHAFNRNPNCISSTQEYFDTENQKILSEKAKKIRFVKLLVTSTLAFATYFIAEIALGN